MRKALIPAFLLVAVAIVLGSTVFREQIATAAMTPFQNVVVLKFDGSGNLETAAQTASPGDDVLHTICSEDAYVTDITATGMDDALGVKFLYHGNVVLVLWGSSDHGQASYQMDLTHPIHIDEIQAYCNNGSTSCDFNMAVLGNSTGN
jgi:hypothetical protein